MRTSKQGRESSGFFKEFSGAMALSASPAPLGAVLCLTIISLLCVSISCSGLAAKNESAAHETPKNETPKENVKASAPVPKIETKTELRSGAQSGDREICMELVKSTVRSENLARLQGFCERVSRLPKCTSREGRPIFHFEKSSNDKRGKRILALGLIHGDEPLAGEMSLEWTERLAALDKHRSTWRFVPLLNPDGMLKKTRVNSSGVDLNRNFPTRDWDSDARSYWEKSAKKDPRRFPGEGAGSEPETKCVIAHIKDFKPDFIVSAHTPYKVLDFDGPTMKFPGYKDLPWRALGNFPGSLGRYMWHDYKIPVLTVELGQSMIDSSALQDLIGSFALDAVSRAGAKKPDLYDLL